MSYRLTLTVLCFFFCFSRICWSLQESDSRSTQLLNEQVAVAQTEGQLSYIFGAALRSAHVPGGIVSVSSCSTESEELRYTFPATNGTLGSILDSIATLNHDSLWELHNGAINLLPRSFTVPLLDVIIQEFVIDKPKMSISSSVGRLLEVPEVKEALSRFKLHEPGPSLILWLGDTAPHEIKLKAHNVTVREALNEIAKAHGSAVWEYSESHCDGKNTFSITWVSR